MVRKIIFTECIFGCGRSSVSHNVCNVSTFVSLLTNRISEHRGTIVNEKVDKAVGEHFNSRGHQLSDFSYTVLEVVTNPDPEYLKEREALYIRKFDTKRNGLNKSY